jgi:hypothetical protein
MEAMPSKPTRSDEPILTFRLSRPERFYCSACSDVGDPSPFTLDLWTSDMVEIFRDHVRRYHPNGGDFSQAGLRTVRNVTKDKQSFSGTGKPNLGKNPCGMGPGTFVHTGPRKSPKRG